MNATEIRELRNLARFLATALPAAKPIRLRLADSLPLQGDCGDTGRQVVIRVRQADMPLALGTLVHEHAHAISFGMDGDEPHGEMFLEARRLCFAAFMDWRKDRGPAAQKQREAR